MNEPIESYPRNSPNLEISYRDEEGHLLWQQVIVAVSNGWRVPAYEEYLIHNEEVFRVRRVIWHDGSKYQQKITVVLVLPAEEEIRKAIG